MKFDFQGFVVSYSDPLLFGRKVIIMNYIIRYSEGVNNPKQTSGFSVTLWTCLESLQMVSDLYFDGLGKYSIVMNEYSPRQTDLELGTGRSLLYPHVISRVSVSPEM